MSIKYFASLGKNLNTTCSCQNAQDNLSKLGHSGDCRMPKLINFLTHSPNSRKEIIHIKLSEESTYLLINFLTHSPNSRS